MLLLLFLVGLSPCQWVAEGRVALQEDVNVLIYGTLQLGQGIADTYSSTTGKLQRAEARQGWYRQGLERLQEKVARARQEEQRLRTEVRRLQREEQEIRTLSRAIAGELQDLQKEYGELQRRVRQLEDGVQEEEGDTASLKTQAERQHLIIQVVVEAVRQQQEQMEKQRMQINHILRKVSEAGLS